jgi:hypothetical protein
MGINMPCLRTVAAVAACAALGALALPTAAAAPTSDASGYVDSVARCAPPSQAVLFGSTASSRVAICKTSTGGYEYRGVRMRDGAKLVVPASRVGDEFSAENDGISYLVSEKSLVINAGTRMIREEPMLDFHQPQAAAAPAPTSKTTPTTPLPPPLAAEVGGSRS